jgi:hypothetical protein
MCFSATASFATAVVVGTIGIVAIALTAKPRELPLASIPLLLAVQQAAEGTLWLTLPVAPKSAVTSLMTNMYLFFALVFWPVFSPLVPGITSH